MTSKKTKANIEILELWRLPDNFFSLPGGIHDVVATTTTNKNDGDDDGHTNNSNSSVHATQRDALRQCLRPAPDPSTMMDRRRVPCDISWTDDVMAVSFFLITMGLPLLLLFGGIMILTWYRTYVLYYVSFILISAFHPLPSRMTIRHSRLAMALVRYFSMEVIIDWDDPLMKQFFLNDTTMIRKNVQEQFLPFVGLACPHGVFNYGAMVWCCMSRYLVGWEQYTGAAAVLQYVPGLRYMDGLIWAINADRRSIQRALRERPTATSRNKRFGGMLGMVPDGILGAFRCKPGVDELIIGKRRGLLRICAQEGALVMVSWFFGTTDMLTVVTDPFGIMEYLSRKLQAGMLIAYGRFYLMVPRRIPVSASLAMYRIPKNPEPTKEELEAIHQRVYGGLEDLYDRQKVYAGYADRKLKIS